MSKIIFNFLTSITFLCLIFLSQVSYAQLSGSYTIPGSPFTTLTSCVDSLNEVGVGSNGVTINISGGYIENITSPILLTATGTSSNNIVIQKSGSGANPLITRTDGGSIATSIAGGQGDAVIIIEGSDYVTINAIDVATTNQGIEYGYYLRRFNGNDGSKYVTIKNSVIDLTKGTSGYVTGIYSSNNDAASSPSLFEGIEVTSIGGRSENVTIIGNTVQDVHTCIMLRGYNHNIEPYDFQDQNFIVGQNGFGNTLQNYAGGSNTTSYGIVLLYQTSPNVSYNVINSGGGGLNATYDLYGISMAVSNSGGAGIFNNNSITLSQGSTRTTRSLYLGSDGTSYTINNNTFGYGTFASTQISYMIYCINSTPNITLINNRNTTPINKTGASGNFYFYNNTGAPTGGTEIYADNNFSNITVTGTSRIYGIYSNTTPGQNKISYNNTLSNWTGNTGEIHCLYLSNADSNKIFNNNIYNISGNGHVWGLEFSGNSPEVYRNNIYNITAGGFSLYGIQNNGTGTTKCYENQIYNLTGNNTSQSLYGLYIGSGTNQIVYNNFISDLKAPNANITAQTIGIFVSGGDSVGLYYNTVFLHASSIGANYGTVGIFASTATVLDLRNNIVINTSTANGSGYTVAYQRSNSTLVTYANVSNNNNFYVGAPGDTSHLIFKDNTNKIQTMTDYKVFVAPRDAASFTENSPFVNSIVPPYDLHINQLIATQTESGGVSVEGITDDFDGDLRNVSTPDVGADEFEGTTLDVTPPVISYAPLLNTGLTTNRLLTANITDPSGVPLSGIGLPVLYWRINSGSWSAAVAIHTSGDDYEFSFGAGVIIGDTVKYYICAQDNLGNVGANPSEGASGFTTNPPAASNPPIEPSSYSIIDVPLAGDYTVGLTEFNLITGKNITFEKSVHKVMRQVPDKESNQNLIGNDENLSANIFCDLIGKTKLVEVDEITWIPMQNGKVYNGSLYVKKIENPNLNFPIGVDGIYATITAAVIDLNLRGVSAPVNFLLTDATYSTETFPIIVNVNNAGLPSFDNPVIFKPNTGVTSVISGLSDDSQLFQILSDYIIMDGSNSGGITRDLTLENTSVDFPQVIWIASIGETPRTNVTIKNCNIINGYDSSPIVVSDAGLLGADGWFNEILIENNNIQKALHGIYCRAYVSPGNGSGLIIRSNDLSTSGENAVTFNGMYIQGVDEAYISDNNIANFGGSLDVNYHGIWLAEGTTNTLVERNIIHNLNYNGTGGFGAHGITVSTETMDANNSLINNVIYNLSGDGKTYISWLRDNPHGICIYSTQSGINVYYNSIHLFGNTLNSSNALSTGIALGAGSSADIRNNNIVNNLGLAGGIGYGSAGIFLQADATQLVLSDNNNFFVSPSGSGAKLVGKIVSSDYTTLLGWQTATGQDNNSLATDPQFVANDDLRPMSTSPILAAGTPLSWIPEDILGVTRSETSPTIGAYEEGVGTNSFQLSVNVSNGWNMVSVPGLHPIDQNVNTWWQYRDLGANVFRYLGGYQPVTAAAPGIGYWMKHSGARTYNTGEEWPAGGIQIVAHEPLTAASGWNLIGGYELSVGTAGVTTNPSGLQEGPIYKYSSGYQIATTLDPGYGYWMKLSADGQIIIPETLAKDGKPVEYFPENWGKIILTDATGINYTLYAVKGEVDLSQYELPPAPPTGMFDIRFSSGRIAEDLNSAIKTIDMSGVTYPLTVRVEGMDIRLMDETGKTVNVNLKDGEDIVISDATISKLMVSGEMIPAEYALEQNYPNPFNPSTVIEFSLPENVGNVKLSIYNALGEKVAELVNTALVAGKYSYQWNAQNVATGMYIYELRTDKFVSVKKMLLLK